MNYPKYIRVIPPDCKYGMGSTLEIKLEGDKVKYFYEYLKENIYGECGVKVIDNKLYVNYPDDGRDGWELEDVTDELAKKGFNIDFLNHDNHILDEPSSVPDREFKITFYVTADGRTCDVFDRTIEESIWKNRDKLIDSPYVLSVNRLYAEEVE